eukprot:scaffold678828_cov62-Prasinocladus_malaysianus.AAC.1
MHPTFHSLQNKAIAVYIAVPTTQLAVMYPYLNFSSMVDVNAACGDDGMNEHKQLGNQFVVAH